MSFSVIIPSRNEANLEACVTSLRSYGENCRIIAIDNGLRARRDDVEYVDYGSAPFVYSRAINLGAVTAGTDDLVIIGDDTRLLSHGGLTALSRTAGMISPAIVSAVLTDAVRNQNQLATHPPWRAVLRLEPKILCFIAIAISRATWDTVGRMDERYTGYGCDDDDYCYRARLAGVKLAVYEGCRIEHGVLPSEFRHAGDQSYAANAAIFERIHGVPYGS